MLIRLLTNSNYKHILNENRKLVSELIETNA